MATRYAIIKDGIVQNVILCEPENLCVEPGCECLKWHPPAGSNAVADAGGLNTDDARTRPAGPGDLVTKVTGARAKTRPYDYAPGPPREVVPTPPTPEERIAALEAVVAQLRGV